MPDYLDATDGTPVNDPSLGVDPLTGDVNYGVGNNLGIDPLTGELDPASAMQTPSVPFNSSPSTAQSSGTSIFDNLLKTVGLGATIVGAFTARQNVISNPLGSQQRIATAPKTAGTGSGTMILLFALFIGAILLVGKFLKP
jgi:hypothetical protein